MSELKAITGFNNRKNGMSFERKVHARIKRQRGLFTLHADGSRGLFDVVSMTKQGKLRCIVVRNNGYLTPAEQNAIHDFLTEAPKYIQVELHYKKSPRKSGHMILKI